MWTDAANAQSAEFAMSGRHLGVSGNGLPGPLSQAELSWAAPGEALCTRPLVLAQHFPASAPICPQFLGDHVMSVEHRPHILQMDAEAREGMENLVKVLWQERDGVPMPSPEPASLLLRTAGCLCPPKTPVMGVIKLSWGFGWPETPLPIRCPPGPRGHNRPFP